MKLFTSLKQTPIKNCFIVLLVLAMLPGKSQTVRILEGHSKPIISLSFSRDSKYLSSVSSDKTMIVWDVNSGSKERTLYDNENGETSSCFSPDNKLLVSGSWDTVVKVWDWDKTTVLKRMKGHTAAVKTVDFDPTGRFVASAGWDKEILVWNVKAGITYQTLKGHRECLRSLSFSPDGNILASAGYDLELKIWDVKNGKLMYSLPGHKYPIESVNFSPDGIHVATGGVDNTIKIWNIQTGKLEETLNDHKETVYSVCFSPDGKYIVSGSFDKTITIHDIAGKKIIKTLIGHTQPIKAICFSPDGKCIASAGNERTVRLWDVSYLHIKPLATKPYVELKDVNIFDWNYPTTDSVEFYQHKISLKLGVHDANYNNFKLFVNQKEHSEYDGAKQNSAKPIITGTGDSRTLDYQVYLHDGENEILPYAENVDGNNSIGIPKTVIFRDLSQQVDKSDLYVYVLNVNSQDKKLSGDLKTESETDLINQLNSLKGKLYRQVYITQISGDNQTKVGIETSINSFMSKPKESDKVIVLIQGLFVEDNNENIYILPGDTKKNKVEENKFDFSTMIYDLEKTRPEFSLFVEIHKPAIETPGYTSIEPKRFEDYTLKKINSRRNGYSVNISKNNLFSTMSLGLKQAIDTDKNNAISLFELNKYLDSKLQSRSVKFGHDWPFILLKEIE